MGKKKKKDCLFHVDGFEEWMNQFCSDLYANSPSPNDIHVDLFETEQEYILEADIPNVVEQNILIKKMETGLQISVSSNNSALQHMIFLPANIIYKKMLAYLENGLLAIHISKTEAAQLTERTVLLTK
ncbi:MULTISPECIES: Hsp20/alpha crystallin family protein [unclassified Bacillus (in: firmicutes)]|uniref:Hsp20/alpha crystallin family protein n=1 Tax=unclassified Bacillus (in: firmicutes) TaxID=185979 RepID=UPI0008EEEF5B|nr:MULTISPECIES: Hsp20/alpha crystallin family protein [unclassified Bacillus (in: firmicutes)]SFI32486.1 spore coat protein M [Bacillus sp. 71mf]SFS37096.1 spore coat protein M [Bacillus sp. 103mf]